VPWRKRGGITKLSILYFQRLLKFLVVQSLYNKEIPTMSESEVARLCRQIELELEAMQRGMNGFALGSSRHKFIHQRMGRVGACQDKLVAEVGEDKADEIVYGIYTQTFS
jgi:hypothetical protein